MSELALSNIGAINKRADLSKKLSVLSPKELKDLVCCKKQIEEFVLVLQNKETQRMANGFPTKILCSFASLFICSENLQDDLKELAILKDKLTVLREDVLQRVTGGDGPKMTLPWPVKVWLSNVELKLAEANKLISYGVERYWFCFGRRVNIILYELMDLKDTAPLPGELENKLEEVWNCLTTDEVGVIGIWGMGGIGKTTLLTQLRSKCLSHFDFVIWLQVSQEAVQLDDFQNEVVKQIGLSDSNFNDKTALISQALQKKKVLVLLDDLWNRVELEEIGIPQNKCQVVFTTRSKVVCRLMEAQRTIKVEPLGKEEAWRLFQDRVGFESFAPHPRISSIAREIVRECQGLPLALVTSAHAMSSEKALHDWKNYVEFLRKHTSTHVFSNLKSSYDSLPHQNMKSCLLYCALFPKNFDIRKQELIDKWICEGFLDDGSDQADPINEGYDIVKTLVDLSLLEDRGERVRMHDVTRDMCLWIACEVEKEKENYFVQAGTKLRKVRKVPPMGEWRDARRISLMRNETSLIQRLTEVPASPCLLTLLLSCNYEMESITNGFFRHMKALTVLDLSQTGLRVLPPEISELVSLQYLDVSCTKIETLPEGITKLEKLQCFNLQHTSKLREIPRWMIANLKSLQVFRIAGSQFTLSKFSVEELESSKSLKAFSITVRDREIYHYLFKSHKLSRCIQLLLVEGLGPPYGEFLGKTAQTFYKTGCFDSLGIVNIYCCHYLQDLTWVMRAPNLRILGVRYCENLKVISYEGAEEEEDPNPFPRLQVLDLMGLPQLKKICSKPMLFPFLDKICVCRCPMLKKLPVNTNSAKGRQLVIEGSTDWWSSLQWEDDSTRISFEFCFRETVWFSRRDGTSTPADRERRIQLQLHRLEEKLESCAGNKIVIEELLWNFNNYAARINGFSAESEDVEGGLVKDATDNEAQKVKDVANYEPHCEGSMQYDSRNTRLCSGRLDSH